MVNHVLGIISSRLKGLMMMMAAIALAAFVIAAHEQLDVTPDGRIVVETPQVYTRERLVNDRLEQDTWLNRQLRDIKPDDFEPTRQEMRDSVIEVKARLKADSAHKQVEKTNEMRHDGAQAAGKISNEAAPAIISRVPPHLKFLAANTHRELVRTLALENQLDDRHDLEGTTLFLLKFDSTILPGKRTKDSALIHVELSPADGDYAESMREVSKKLDLKKPMALIRSRQSAGREKDKPTTGGEKDKPTSGGIGSKQIHEETASLSDKALDEMRSVVANYYISRQFAISPQIANGRTEEEKKTVDAWRRLNQHFSRAEHFFDVWMNNIKYRVRSRVAKFLHRFKIDELRVDEYVDLINFVLKHRRFQEKALRQVHDARQKALPTKTDSKTNEATRNEETQAKIDLREIFTKLVGSPLDDFREPDKKHQNESDAAAWRFVVGHALEKSLKTVFGFPAFDIEIPDIEKFNKQAEDLRKQSTTVQREQSTTFHDESAEAPDFHVRSEEFGPLIDVQVSYPVDGELIGQQGGLLKAIRFSEPVLNFAPKKLALFSHKKKPISKSSVKVSERQTPEGNGAAYERQADEGACDTALRQNDRLLGKYGAAGSVYSSGDHAEENIKELFKSEKNVALSEEFYQLLLDELGEPSECGGELRRQEMPVGLLTFIQRIRWSGVYTYVTLPRVEFALADRTTRSKTLGEGQTGVGAVGGEVDLIARRTTNEALRAVEPKVSVVGYSTSDQRHTLGKATEDQQPTLGKAAEDQQLAADNLTFGWRLSPIGSGDRALGSSPYFVPVQRSLAAVVRIPAWWEKVSVRVWTAWSDAAPRTPKESRNILWKEPNFAYNITLPVDYESIESILAKQRNRGPTVFVEEMPSRIEASVCEGLSIPIPGNRLWRGTVVMLDDLKAEEVTVLPDMKGIIAKFKKVPFASKSRDWWLSIWTSQGFVRVPVPVKLDSCVSTRQE